MSEYTKSYADSVCAFSNLAGFNNAINDNNPCQSPPISKSVDDSGSDFDFPSGMISYY